VLFNLKRFQVYFEAEETVRLILSGFLLFPCFVTSSSQEMATSPSFTNVWHPSRYPLSSHSSPSFLFSCTLTLSKFSAPASILQTHVPQMPPPQRFGSSLSYLKDIRKILDSSGTSISFPLVINLILGIFLPLL